VRARLSIRAAAAIICIALSAGASAQPRNSGSAASELARSSERALMLFSCSILAQHAAGVTAAARADADAGDYENAALDFSREGREAARAAGEAFRSLASENGAATLFGGHAELLETAEPDFFVGFYFGQAMLDANERLAMAVDREFADLDEAAKAFAAEAAQAFDLQCAGISTER
jgi:hypothetical protein